MGASLCAASNANATATANNTNTNTNKKEGQVDRDGRLLSLHFVVIPLLCVFDGWMDGTFKAILRLAGPKRWPM